MKQNNSNISHKVSRTNLQPKSNNVVHILLTNKHVRVWLMLSKKTSCCLLVLFFLSCVLLLLGRLQPSLSENYVIIFVSSLQNSNPY